MKSYTGISFADEYRACAQVRYEQLLSCPIDDPAWRFSASRNFFEHIPDVPKNFHTHYQDLGNGAFISDISFFATQFPEQARTYWSAKENKLWHNRIASALVEAYWQESRILFVPAGVKLEQPVHLSALTSGERTIEKMVIILQAGSSVVIDERISSETRQSYTAFRTLDCYVGDFAQVRYRRQAELTDNATELQRLSFYAAKGSSCFIDLVNTGGALYKQWVDLLLQGSNAHINFQALSALNGQSAHELLVHQMHNAPDSTSSVVVKVVLADKARHVYQGTIAVAPEAAGTNASQQTKAILLSPFARAVALPELEVKTKDVRCAHGSAVGKLDAEHIVYLQTRGLSLPQAHQLLLEGFIADMLNNRGYDYQEMQKLKARLLATVTPKGDNV